MAELAFPRPHYIPAAEGVTGEKEQLYELCYKLRAYMNVLNPCYSQIISNVDENPYTVIRDEELHDIQQVQIDGGAPPMF